MRNNKGFIATALIYSFFLIFCAVVLSYITNNSHNKNLLEKVNEEIRIDLKDKTLADTQIGDNIKLTITHSTLNIDDVNWIVFNKDTNIYLISDSDILSIQNDNDLTETVTAINRFLNGFDYSCKINNIRIVNQNEINNIRSIYFDNSGNQIRVDSNVNVDFIINNNGTYQKYNLQNNEYNTYGAEKINVRGIIELSPDYEIQGGTGTTSNPYIMSSC